MVCLFGIAIDSARDKYIHHDWFQNYSDSNILIFDMTNFIYNMSPESDVEDHPFIPYMGATIWSKWFEKVQRALAVEFDDATPERVFKCLKNCPAYRVADIIFDTIEIQIVKSYIETNYQHAD